jgi:uncharacterized protein (TIGR02099 family)
MAIIAALGIALRLALPASAAYRGEVESAMSGILGRPSRIESIEASWAGWTPCLVLRGLTLFDDGGSIPILRFAEARIALDVAASLWYRALYPRSLVLVGEELRLVRLADGAITLEGIASGGDRVLRWLLARPRLGLVSERLIWRDERAGRGPYTLTGARLDLVRRGEVLRLGLTGTARGAANGRLELVLEATGDLVGGDWVGELYAAARAVDAGLLADYGRGRGLVETEGRVGLRVWSRWRDGRMTEAAGRLRVRSLRLPMRDGPWRLTRGQAWFGVTRGAAGEIGVTFDRLVVATPRGDWPETRLRFTLGAPEGDTSGSVFAECGYLRIEDTVPLVTAFLSDEQRGLMAGASPRGGVRDVRFAYHPQRAQHYAYAALEGIAIEGDEVSFQGLNGALELDADRGRLVLPDTPVRLGGPALFESPASIEHLGGEVSWHRQGPAWRFQGQGLRVAAAGFEGRASGHIDWWPGASPVVNLRVDLDQGDVARVPGYLPTVVPPAARAWLRRALVGGRIAAGSMVLRGPLGLFPFDTREGLFRVELEVEAGVLDYGPGWPRIEDIAARVVFEGRSLAIDARHGHILGASLNSTRVRIADLGAALPVLEIRGQATGPASAGRQFLLDSPLREGASGAVRELQLGGPVTVDLGLDLPLGPGPSRLSGKVGFPGNAMTARGLAFTDLKGEFTFTGDRFGTEGLAARLFERPVTISMEGGAGRAARVRVVGRADRAFIQARLGEWLPALAAPAWLASLDGETDLEVSVTAEDLAIRSSLAGLAIRAPAPLGKQASEPRPLEITTRAGDGGRWFRFRYADIARGEVQMGQGSRLDRLVVRLGPSDRTPPAEARVWLGGSVARLSQSEWRRFLEPPESTRTQGPAGPDWPAPLIDIDVERFEALGLDFGRVGIKAGRTATDWAVALTGDRAEGDLRIPHGASRSAIEARFEHLMMLPEETAGPVETPDPRRLPGLVFRCRHCAFGATELGEVRLKTRPGPEGLSIYDVTARARDFELAAVGIWQGMGGPSSSRFDVEVKGPDLGTMLAAFGYRLAIEGGTTDLQIQARWPGSPADFTLSALEGSLDLEVLDGRLLEVDQGMGRVFGLLSLHALQRRLRLDFTDLFGKGFAFDRIGGRFSIAAGDAYTNDLSMEGPSARIDISGRTGLVKRDYDQSVTVTPAIAATLPLGAAVLLAEQLFSGIPERINKILERRYRVTGGWDKPVVKRDEAAPGP